MKHYKITYKYNCKKKKVTLNSCNSILDAIGAFYESYRGVEILKIKKVKK